MATVVFESRNSPIDSKHFNFSHEARTWLLLSGYLPVDNEGNRYVNLFTSDEAHIYTVRVTECE